MAKSHFSGPIIQGTDQRPAASTNVFTNRIVCAAAASFSGAVSMSGALTSSSGFTFAGGNYKKFAAGTYIGSAGATAAITSTGLTTTHHVWMTLRGSAFGSAATSDGRVACAPTLANGTPSKFYPRAYRSGATNKEIYLGLGGIPATFSWIAVGV